MSNPILCICLLEQTAIAYQSHDWETWIPIHIKGEPRFPHQNQLDQIHIMLDEINQSFNLDDALHDVHLCMIYSENQAKLALQSLTRANTQFKNQIFSSRPLQRLHQYYLEKNPDAEPLDLAQLSPECFQQHLLPLFSFDYSWKQTQKRLAELEQKETLLLEQQKAHESTFQQLQAQHAKTQQAWEKQIADKKHELSLLTAPDLENLSSFLPAIFKDFWNTVRPDELATIAGLLTPPKIPSPFPSLSNAAVQSKKRQFLALSTADQQQILQFCILLKKDFDLRVHLEFQPLIGELD